MLAEVRSSAYVLLLEERGMSHQRPAGGCEEGDHGLCGGDSAGGGSRLPVSVCAGSEGLCGAAEEAGCAVIEEKMHCRTYW